MCATSGFGVQHLIKPSLPAMTDEDDGPIIQDEITTTVRLDEQ